MYKFSRRIKNTCVIQLHGMENRKTIVVNPELFKIPTTNTSRRKRRDGTAPKPIKMRVPGREYNKTSRSHLIRQIRNMQEAKYRNMMQSDKPIRAPLPAIPSLEDSFHNEFEDSLTYLSSIAEKNKRVAQNATIRQYPSYDPGAPSMSIPMRPGIGDEMTRAYLEGDPSTHVDLGIPEVFAEVPTNSAPP